MYARGGDPITKKRVYLHRYIFNITDTSIEVDHIDGNGLNNRRYNLRICEHRLNGKNKRKNKNKINGYKGVTKASKNRFQARITVDNVLIWIGSYKTQKEAAIAYNEAAVKHYGEFAKLNGIENDSNGG